jgi:hypothetical protein
MAGSHEGVRDNTILSRPANPYSPPSTPERLTLPWESMALRNMEASSWTVPGMALFLHQLPGPQTLRRCTPHSEILFSSAQNCDAGTRRLYTRDVKRVVVTFHVM